MHPTSVDPLLDHRADELAASRAGLDDAARRRYLERLVEPFGPGQARWLERTEDVELADHRRERWLIEVLPGVRFHTYRLVPHGWTSGGPAVVVVHGHGYGSREVLGLDADGRPVAEPRTTPVALHTAAQGLLTLVPDVVGFGERTTDRDLGYDPDASHSCYRLGTRLLLQGATLTGLRVAELLGLIAAPTDDPAGARPGRLGLLGFSGGGMWAMIAAALDDRIAATALCAYPNLFATSIEPIRHCLCNHLPGLLAVGEQPDFAALIHPRALFCETGRNDPIFPVAGFEAAVDALERRWADHPDAFGHDVHEGGHQISGARSVPWLFRRLSVSD